MKPKRKEMMRSRARILGRLAMVAAVGAPIWLWGMDAMAQVAFPGAEGFGATATGGRGGRVVKVTTLESSGAGSFQWALDQTGPRIIVFDVSGVIEGDVTIPHGDVTIAGQSAPGGGITLHGRLFAQYDENVQNIVVRFLRVRPPPLTGGSDGEQYDAIQFSRNSKFILDHISVSWASDEVVDLYEADDATVQWSTIEESSTEGHPEGEHNYGMINGPDGHRISIHHNLFAHHRNRCPAVANGPGEILNNVIYDAQNAFVHHNESSGTFNIVGNYYRKGPSADLFPFYFDGGTAARYYLHNNYIDDPDEFTDVVDDPWESGAHSSFANMEGDGQGVAEPFDFSGEPTSVPVSVQDVSEAYNWVLSQAGAFPRDVVTRRTLAEVEDRTGSWGAKPPSDLFEGLAAESPPLDTDGDGMPDEWETAHGLDPNVDDATNVMPSGYTAIEDYLNERATLLLGGAVGGGGPSGGSGGTGAPGTGGTTPAAGGDSGSSSGYVPSNEEASGCACRTTPGTTMGATSGLGAWLLLMAAGWRRRRVDG